MVKRDWPIVFLVAVTCGVAGGRMFYPTRGLDTFGYAGSYEAAAHVWWGVLAGAALACWLLGRLADRRWRAADGLDRLGEDAIFFAGALAFAALALALFEVLAFFFWR